MMTKSQVYDYLRAKGLRITDLKREVVDLFLGGGCGLSLGDVVTAVNPAFHQSSVYRCLKSLTEVGFLRHSLGDQGTVRYRCTSSFIPDHGHFHCRICGSTSPVKRLPESFITEISSGMGVKVETFDFIMEGRCSLCAGK